MKSRSGERAKKSPARVAPAFPREVRIVGGTWKRSKLPVLDRPGLRPTPDRVRETVFNWLGQTLDGWRCIDAFAGTGALGFEAASRGAAEVVLIERDAAVIASLQATRQRLGAASVRIERADALQWLARAPAASADLVFLDPPFGSTVLGAALAAAAAVVRDGGGVYVEGPEPVGSEDAAALGLEPWRAGRAGVVHFQLLRKATPA